PARIVNVASAAHKIGRLDFDDLHFEEGYGQFRAYARSKLANVLFTRELARRLEGSRVTANCLHPGTIGSNFGRTGGGVYRVLANIARPLLKSTASGARTSIWLASAPEVAETSGEYFVGTRARQPAAAALDDESAKIGRAHV